MQVRKWADFIEIRTTQEIVLLNKHQTGYKIVPNAA